jgi:transposase
MPQIWYMKQLGDYERKIKKQGKEIEELQRELEAERRKRKAAENESNELRDELKQMAERKTAKKPKFPDYSLSRQERLLGLKKVFRSPGRTPKEAQLHEVTREEDVYPKGVPPTQCVPEYTRIVTHLRDGSKEVVLYRIHKQKWSNKRGKLPHVMPAGEYGMEVAVTLAFLVYTIGVSHDQAMQVMQFFCNIELSRSEADSLLSQISKRWEKEFEKLCDLMLLAFVVHIDETGWREGKKNCYTWIFKSLSHTVLLYGKRRNEEVLDSILPRKEFKGIGVSDGYRIYEKYFKEAQKCWAHFLRKIIKLMLLYPEKKQYKAFFESLFEIFNKGKKLKQDSKLTHKQKKQEVDLLKEQIQTLCTEKDTKINKDTPKDWREFVNLQKNLMRNINDLFTFVLHEGVEPTNNKAEQGLRFTAKARNNYQTSKTVKGSKRRSVIASVLASLQQSLPEFSLRTVTEESYAGNRRDNPFLKNNCNNCSPNKLLHNFF